MYLSIYPSIYLYLSVLSLSIYLYLSLSLSRCLTKDNHKRIILFYWDTHTSFNKLWRKGETKNGVKTIKDFVKCEN